MTRHPEKTEETRLVPAGSHLADILGQAMLDASTVTMDGKPARVVAAETMVRFTLRHTGANGEQPMADQDPQPDRQEERIISTQDVKKRLGLSIPTIWRMRRRGEFPEPIRLSPGRVGWREPAIERWLAEREGAAR